MVNSFLYSHLLSRLFCNPVSVEILMPFARLFLLPNIQPRQHVRLHNIHLSMVVKSGYWRSRVIASKTKKIQKFQKPDRRFMTNEKLVQRGDHPKTQKFQKIPPKPKFQKPKNKKLDIFWLFYEILSNCLLC